jgi:hypothetical protein
MAIDRGPIGKKPKDFSIFQNKFLLTLSRSPKKRIMIGDIPVIDLMDKGLRAIRGKRDQLSAFFEEMDRTPNGYPSNQKAAEIFQLEADDLSEAAATVTFLVSRYAIGDLTMEQIEKGLRELEFSGEEVRSFVSGVRKLSEKTLRVLKTRALVLAVKRVLPSWQSYRSSIDFKPVTEKGTLRAIVPFVGVKMTFRTGAGRTRELNEVTFELSIMELLSFMRALSSIYGRLKRETVRLSEKMGDVVVNPETVEAMFQVTADV